jgi:Lytic transglycolase
MATSRLKRSARPVHAVAGVLVLAVPSSALALTTAAGASTQAAQLKPALSPIESLKLHSSHLAYGRDLTVSGTTSRLAAGRRVELELATEVPHTYEGWRVLATSTISSTGSFRLSARMRESGTVRVAGAPAVSAPKLTTREGATGSTGVIANDAVPTITASNVRRVTVAPELKIAGKSLGLVGSERGFVHGYLEPGRKGRRVAVQAREHGRWMTVASTRTGRFGGYTMRFGGGSISGAPLRVDFPGDAQNTPRSIPAGTATVLSPVVASWYDDAGNTACGFHAYYGVANLSLPCGAHVTISNGHTTVVATVDDRGPYVGGRVYDLNQNVAQALGFGGVGTVYTSIS